MFADTKAFGAFAVDDLAQARKFYGETLGVGVSGQHGLLTLHLAGGHDVRVYPRPGHTPATYTILMFQVDDIEAAVRELTKRGVQFERYDGMDKTRGASPRAATSRSSPPGSRTRPETSSRCRRSGSASSAGPGRSREAS